MAHPNSRLLLGVDTGGTYTDAVVLDADSHDVLASAKALTTRHDLAVGVSNALSAIAGSLDPARVALVSLSTTLATNAVVEGHGSPILIFLVGFDDAMVERTRIGESFRDAIIVLLEGGHDHFGAERIALDVAAASAALAEHGEVVRAVAVASTFAVRNPKHEHVLRDLVVAETELPVTVSSSLSESLDAPRRALTTALNARLLSRITDLVDAVQRSLDVLGIVAPVMVAKGDGSLAAAEVVARRPIETVLSGPAASIVGAATLTGLRDFVLSDIGGTTTDVGQLRNGRPRLVSDGARVGGWRTMVSAIDVRTTGLGGDSEVHTDRSDITVGPRRRIPISLLAVDHPSIVRELERDLVEPPPRDLAAAFVVRVGDTTSFVGITPMEQRILGRLSEAPAPLRQVAGGAIERRALDVLSEKGVVQVAGFTPSDAAHMLGMQTNWSTSAARAAGALMAWYTADDPEVFARRVWSETVRQSAACVLDVAFDDGAPDVLDNPVLDAVASGRASLGRVRISLRPDDPIVAVGGPAGVFYGEVARRCGAELVLPAQFAVANAVGAAAGHVVARSQAEVHADGPGSFRVISGLGTESVGNATEALALAERRALGVATTHLVDGSIGLDDRGILKTHVDVTRHDAPDASGDDGLYSAHIDVEVRSRPVARTTGTVDE